MRSSKPIAENETSPRPASPRAPAGERRKESPASPSRSTGRRVSTTTSGWRWRASSSPGAVPKGPSLDTKTKRLAVPTEDHPLDYIDFEGTIPEGEYGAGTVIVWDIGTYENTTEADGKQVPMTEALEKGHATVFLSGKKLVGGFALTRTGRGKNERWILVKMKDDFASSDLDILEAEPDSALTGRSVEEVGGEE